MRKARKVQKLISNLVVQEDGFDAPPKIVCGLDVSYVKNKGIAGAVCLSYESLEVLERSHAVVDVTFPYIPTLLAFRELRPIVVAYKKLKLRPDVVFVDAQGYAHPYRCGLACHFGVVTNTPTVGVAKKKLYGVEVPYKNMFLLKDPKTSEIVGASYPIGGGRKLYISVGHMVSLDTAIKLVVDLVSRGNGVFPPTQLAHQLVTELRRSLKSGETR